MESNETFCTDWYLLCTHACLAKHLQSPGHPAAAVEHFFPCVQVFGDYYHFRHHAVEKRALSGHRGMHVRLHKEPQVRALSVSHSTLQLAAAKIQKTDCIREKNVNITTEGKKIFRCHWQLVKLWTLLQPHRFFNLPPSAPSEVPPRCTYVNWIMANGTKAGSALCVTSWFFSCLFKIFFSARKC